MKALILKLRLVRPLLATGLANGEENSARSLPYIPGGLLRGALASKYRRSHKVADLRADERGARLFFNPSVRFLNGYLDVRGVRSLPTSAAWHTEKHADLEQGETAWDFALAGVPDPQDVEEPEGLRDAFCRVDPGAVEALGPERVVNVHIAGDKRGVVEEGNNTVFHYEGLAADQNFTAVVLAEATEDLEALKALADQGDMLRLGGSRSAGYGQARVEAARVETTWQEAGGEAPGDVAVLTLLSDAILRDANGQPTLDLDVAVGPKRRAAFVRTAWAGGFNRQWKLPLPQSEALGAGSVFVYAAKDVPPETLARLAEQGVGERRTDGFGRVAVNWGAGERFVVHSAAKESRPGPAVKALSAASRDQARDMATRMLRAQLDERLVEKSARLVVWNAPPNHQLSRLRAVVRAALAGAVPADRSADPVLGFFSEEQMKEAARRLFERARVVAPQETRGERLIHWVQDRIERPGPDGKPIRHDVLAWLGYGEHMTPRVAGQAAPLDEALTREYALRLIDAVLARAMKANRQKEGGE